MAHPLHVAPPVMMTFSKKWVLVPVVVMVTGCSAMATFHATTTREFPRITWRAVILAKAEADVVMAAGEVIGTIAGFGLGDTSTIEDVNNKAAEVAAEKGGSHVIVRDGWVETSEEDNPAYSERRCSRTVDGRVCRTTYYPAHTTTHRTPRADYLVVRVAPQQWATLPSELRPTR